MPAFAGITVEDKIGHPYFKSKKLIGYSNSFDIINKKRMVSHAKQFVHACFEDMKLGEILEICKFKKIYIQSIHYNITQL